MELKFLFVFLFLPSTTLGYFITVEAYDEHCFYDKVTSGTKMGLLFEVAEGGFRDIDVTVSKVANCRSATVRYSWWIALYTMYNNLMCISKLYRL